MGRAFSRSWLIPALFSCLVAMVVLGPVYSAGAGRQIPVVVDTDMDLDDVRALNLMLHSPRIEVKAVVTCDGAVRPATGVLNLRRVLIHLGRRGLPLGRGEERGISSPYWRCAARVLGWAKLPPAQDQKAQEALRLLGRVLAAQGDKVVYVCLGPLSNLARLLQEQPAAKSRIRSVVFSASPPHKSKADTGWNSRHDVQALGYVLASGLPVYFCSLPDQELVAFDQDFNRRVQGLKTPAADLLRRLHQDPRMRAHIQMGDFLAWDDTVALYLHNPDLGVMKRVPGAKGEVFALSKWDGPAARRTYLEILSGAQTGSTGTRGPNPDPGQGPPDRLRR